MSQQPEAMCRWGILSTATIGQKNWQAIKLSGNGQLIGVASRNLAKAQSFIDRCQSSVPHDSLPRAIEGYEAMLTSDDIDAVYIPLPTGLRKEWVIRAAESGKHVMCEKPCALNAADLREMTDACHRNSVQFMDGVMYMHSVRLNRIREILDRPDGIGKIKRIAMQFSFCSDDEFRSENIRTNSRLEPQGCLGDLGWYTIRFALWALNYEMPVSVTARILSDLKRDTSERAVPMEIEATLRFRNGISATFYNSFLTGHQQWAHISGTEGSVWIPDFVLPFGGEAIRFSMARPSFDVSDCQFLMTENREEFSIAESADSAVNSQETNLFRAFGRAVLSGEIQSHWPQIALKTQAVMDACLESAGSDGQTVEIATQR